MAVELGQYSRDIGKNKYVFVAFYFNFATLRSYSIRQVIINSVHSRFEMRAVRTKLWFNPSIIIPITGFELKCKVQIIESL